MMELAIYDLQESFDKMGQSDIFKFDDYLDDIQTWLRGAVTTDKTLKVAAEINAAAVFQNCLFLICKPLNCQSNMITAHGRTEEGANTGLVIQNCTISGEPEYLVVKDTSKTYLRRPWKAYARTLIIDTQIDYMIHKTGWATWPGADYDKTCWFAEFRSRGPGANASWPGIKKVDLIHVANFLPEKFIQADH